MIELPEKTVTGRQGIAKTYCIVRRKQIEGKSV